MKDHEMTKLCATAMGMKWSVDDEFKVLVADGWRHQVYCPLKNDKQAMALLRRCGLHVNKDGGRWWCQSPDGTVANDETEDLNRAIVECVAKMQKARNAVNCNS